ncbi:MAG: NitT/TauT family transport system permease protein [Chloroflexota bacterium]|jgi:NitT/TauT family transport system permease protein|nr:NitT/TauT family transport system permease protein [Chloroflexota bacterium]
MASATATRGGFARPAPERAGAGRWRRVASALLLVAVVLVVWEGLKLLGGTPWRAPGAIPGSNSPVLWNPPFRWPFVNDLNLPHVWNIGLAFVQPWQRGADRNVAQFLFDAALFTWREAALGFALGAAIGLLLATIFVHSRLLERAFVPYVVASQTVPIIALAPMITYAFGGNTAAVVVIATYLTFFPVTIAMIRGLRSLDPRALELTRSYAASRWQVYRKLRLPASLPYLFTALKIAATASIVGAIIGEGPGGIADGLGRAIINYNQYYITGPEKLWAAIIVSGLLGVAFYLVVRAVEIAVLRRRPGAAEG